MRVSISLLSFAAAESPCPSERCWSFDEASGNCELLPGCAEVLCDANALRIEFVPEYFGVENNGEAEFADSYFDDGKYFTNCNLGECGMRADYNEDGDIVFSVEIHDEQQSIKIGDLELFQESQPTTLTASCVYASTVSVSSNAFNLTFADASHDLVGVGDFGSQFSMSISDKNGETGGEIMIGEPVTVDIEWQKELNYLGFFPTDCYVALGDDDEQQAEIIKGGCFSSTLGVIKTGLYGEKLHERKTGFTFASFSGSSELTSQNVKITCDLKICFFGDEACYETPSCPTEPAGYEYTEFGCSEEEQRPDINGVCFEDTCNSGKTGICTAWGDPHYKTFDGEQHHYMGTCWHTFAKSTAEGSVGRPAFQFEAKTDDFGSDVVSYVSGIRLFVNGEGDPVRSSDEFRYKIEASREALSSSETPPRPGVKFTGTQMSGLKIFDQETGQVYEKFFDGDGLQVTFSNDGVAITTWFGLKINYQHHNWGLDLILPDCYRKAVNGLCGNWDGVKFDQGLPEIDYKDIESHPENVKHMVLEWSNWADNFVVPDDQCVAGPPGGATNLSHLRAARKRRAIEEADIARAVGLCEKLKSSNPLFQGCPADKPSQFAECIFDVAVDENNYCESAAKARDCIRSRNDPNAAVCDWANSLGCPQTCPENSEFKGCANVCESEQTCQNRWQRNRCNGKNQLDSRCSCKPGFLYEGSRCVPKSNCGCVYGSSYYPIGSKWQPYVNYNCECIGGSSNGGYTRCQSDSCYNKENCVDFSSYPNSIWTRKNNQLGEIPVSINFELGINIYVYGASIVETPEWKNVVHITNNGNYGSHGERIFGIWQNRQNQRNLFITVGTPYSSQYYFQNAFYEEPCPIDKHCNKNYILKRFQNPSNQELVTTQLLYFQGSVFTAITKGLNVLDHRDYELVMEFDALKQDVLQSGTAKVFASDPWHTTASYMPVRQFYYQTFPTIGRSCSDIIDPCSGKKDCQTFVNSCAINPTRSNEVGIVEKPYVHFKISADVQCTNLHEVHQWFSIFHVTTGEDNGSFGSRIFGIWKQNGKASSYHVPVNHHQHAPYYQHVFYPDCENGEWDTHEMEQRQSDTDQAFTVTEYRQIRNGVVVFSGSYEQQTSDLLLYKKFYVYVGDPWYAPGSGFMVRNFFYQKLDGVRFTGNLGSVKTAFEGELRCRKQGGHLAFFRNAEDHERYVSATQFATISFVGAQRIGATDEFVNVDGSTPYLPWRAGEPNHLTEENCVNAYPSDHAVNDLQCNIPAQYSCRIDAQPECVDIEPHCNPAKCDNGFNKKFCLKTCGICESWTPEVVGDISYLEELGPDNCEDTNGECAFWAAENQCMVNPVYMLRHCPASCKQCTPKPCTNTFADKTLIQTPPSPRWSTCHDQFIGPYDSQAIRSSEVGDKVTFTSDCGVKVNEAYRIKAKIECNFKKISSTKAAHILKVKDSFEVRTGHDSSGYYYDILMIDYRSGDLVLLGDDVRPPGQMFHEGDCTEGGFMEFVVNQWIGECETTYTQLVIDGVLRAQFSSSDDRSSDLNFEMGTEAGYRPDLYVHSDLEVKDFTVETFRALPTPPARVSTCENTLIGETPFQSSVVGEARVLTPECGATNSEAYRVKVQVECNFDKIDALPWGKTSHLIRSEMFTLRAGQDGSPSNPNRWFQLFVGRTYTEIDVIALGEDLRPYTTRNSLFLHRGECPEGEFMDFVIEQWIDDDGKIFRQLFINDRLRFQLTTEASIYGNVEFKLGHDSRPDLYDYSDLEIKNFSFESFRSD